MAYTREEFETIVNDIDVNRQVLLAEGRLSVVPDLGRFVIFASGRFTHGYSETDYKSIMAMAERWQAEVISRGTYSAVQIVEHAKAGDVMRAVRDPEIAGLTLAGHGALGEYWTENQSRFLTWHDVAEEPDHLKQGEIWQMTCGHIPSDRGFVAPVATAIVSRLSSVRAAPGAIIDENLVDFDAILPPVFEDQLPLLGQLLDLNDRCIGTKSILDLHGQCLGTKRC